MVVSSATYTELFIPKNYGDGGAFTLESEITRQTYTFEMNDIPDTDGYYHFIIDLTDVKEGEYVYSIGRDTGVIRIGKYNSGDKQYKKEEKHIQYHYGGI